MTSTAALPTRPQNVDDEHQPLEVRQAIARLASIDEELLPPGAADAVLDRARAAARHRAIRESIDAAVAALAAGISDDTLTIGMLHALAEQAAAAECLLAALPDAPVVDIPPDLATTAKATAARLLLAPVAVEVTRPTYMNEHDHLDDGWLDGPLWRVRGFNSEAAWEEDERRIRLIFEEMDRAVPQILAEMDRDLPRLLAAVDDQPAPGVISAASESDGEPLVEPTDDVHTRPRRRPRATAEERRHLAGGIRYLLREQPQRDYATLVRWLTNLADVLDGRPAFDGSLDWTN